MSEPGIADGSAQQFDLPYCTGCGKPAHPGYMACPHCGSPALRTRYPMSGEWNRRLSGVAVSGWGWSIWTGTDVHVVFDASGITVQFQESSETRRYGEISDMTVAGPGTQTRQGYGLIPILDLRDPAGSAINLGLQYLVGKATTTTTTRSFFSFAGPGFELVVLSANVDTQALRWQLAPAFSAWRRAAYEQRAMVATGHASDIPAVQLNPSKEGQPS